MCSASGPRSARVSRSTTQKEKVTLELGLADEEGFPHRRGDSTMPIPESTPPPAP